jgi:hypothetical protein
MFVQGHVIARIAQTHHKKCRCFRKQDKLLKVKINLLFIQLKVRLRNIVIVKKHNVRKNIVSVIMWESYVINYVNVKTASMEHVIYLISDFVISIKFL